MQAPEESVDNANCYRSNRKWPLLLLLQMNNFGVEKKKPF
jgi:hypothetical protein